MESTFDPLREQELLQKESFDIAKGRAREDSDKAAKREAWADSKIGLKFTRTAHSKFVGAVKEFMGPRKKVGKNHKAAKLLKDTGLEPEMVSFLFVKAVFNVLMQNPNKPKKRTSFSINAANLIHTEWRIRRFGDTEYRKSLLEKLKKDMEKRGYPREWRLKTLRMYFDAERIEWQGWSQSEKLAVGYALMVLFRDTTGLIEAPKNQGYVRPAPELVDRAKEAIEASVLSFTLYTPMVIPPRKWSAERNLFRGGYLGKGSVPSYPLVKGTRKRDVDRMLNMDWSQVIPAINSLQETRVRVNRRMVDVFDWVMNDLGGDRAGLPPSDHIELPPTPAGYETDEEVRKEHNRVCFLIHDRNRQDKSKRIAAFYTLHLAKKFARFTRIYFPHNMDVRGRAYPLTAFLSPQGPDFSKGLLEFADAEPIEDLEQGAWLAVAGANAWGNDKVGLQERADWVVDNEWWIVECGDNPKENTQWMNADEPFQFLRFCMEWAGFSRALQEGRVFYSRFPVPVDATNSGLQHYSAMLRDPVGGRSVNLIPGLDRQDIYQDVADAVTRQLFEDAEGGVPEALGWIEFGIDRKMTKRQVMVVPYAGKFKSCLDYTRDAYYDKLNDGADRLWPSEEDNDHISYLAKLIWDAISDTVIKAREAMSWLTKVASTWSKQMNNVDVEEAYSRRLSWKTPDGFEAVQWRPEQEQRRVKSFMEGRIDLTLYEDADTLDPREMGTSMPPNFVHSLDATHMRMSINKAVSIGIDQFMMVHDSFAVHARHMPEFLDKAVKPSFIEMYTEHDPLSELKDRVPFEVPEPPEKGDLDLTGVSESEFFFS